MHSHINIKANGRPMTLPEDFSMTVTEENPFFHDVEMHSDPVQTPIEGNRHLFQNVDDPKSDIRPSSIERIPAQIDISGLPMRTGMIVVQEDEEIDTSFAFNIDEAEQSFKNLIGDLKCQDVPLYNNEKIPIGEKIGNVEASIYARLDFYIEVSSGLVHTRYYQMEVRKSQTFDPQALGFSYPGVAQPSSSGIFNSRIYPNGMSLRVPTVTTSYINVTDPYTSLNGVPAAGGWRYANARVCYAHHDLNTLNAVDNEKEDGRVVKTGTIGETSDDIMKVDKHYGTYEDYGPYWVLDANRQQSGICFYVLYFLDCLFHHLGVEFDNSALMQVEDLRRLVFFTTKCKYTTEPTETTLDDLDEINQWARDRGCGGRIEFYLPEDASVELSDTQLESITGAPASYWREQGIVEIYCKSRFLEPPTATATVMKMYATSENFPDKEVSTIISSLENSFGIRFLYDYQRRKVTAYLMRDLFRQRDNTGQSLQPVDLPCTILNINPLTEKITGIRMKYSAESDKDEQQQNIRTGKRDYDTEFDYADYRPERLNIGEGYRAIASDLRTENVTCYIDKLTANAYRFKTMEDADSTNTSYHRLFEVGQFHGIEVGDCSKKNEDSIKEFVSDFQPVSFNDVNAYAEMKRGSTQPILAAFVDEDMEHEFVTQRINHPVYSEIVDFYATEVLRLVESYNPSNTEDGNSPLQSYDWGLAIAIMRGGGTNATIQEYDRGYDGFGNSRWRILSGSYAMSSDSMDQWGNTYDYNGPQGGDGGGERFSLKIRSWKPFLYYESGGRIYTTSDLSLLGQAVSGVDGKTWLAPCNSAPAIARRGLADVFMSEYFHFLLNRKKLRIHCLAEAATLLDIPNKWNRLFVVGDLVGFIDKFNYTVNATTGIGEVTIDFFAL